MDVEKYIKSKAIVEHIKKIGHQFSLPEKAYIVYRNRDLTLKEKIDAWEELIVTEKDTEQEEWLYLTPFDSYHEFLRQYIEMCRKKEEAFFDNNQKIYIYFLSKYRYENYLTYRMHGEDDGWRENVTLFFFNCHDCIEALKKSYEDDDKIETYVIRRAELNNPDLYRKREEIILNADFEIMYIFMPIDCKAEGWIENLEYQFEGMYFEVPTPFRHGDILETESGNVFVLDVMYDWDSKTMLERGVPSNDRMLEERDSILNRRKEEKGIDDDMCISGYRIDSRGKSSLLPTGLLYPVYWDSFAIRGLEDVFGLDYHEPNDTGEDQLLNILSMLMKKELDVIAYTDLYRHIVLDE